MDMKCIKLKIENYFLMPIVSKLINQIENFLEVVDIERNPSLQVIEASMQMIREIVNKRKETIFSTSEGAETFS
jgi:hypothetical protein